MLKFMWKKNPNFVLTFTSPRIIESHNFLGGQNGLDALVVGCRVEKHLLLHRHVHRVIEWLKRSN